MKKKLVMLTLTVLVVAAVLLFVGCPEEGGGKSYVGTWEYIDYSEGVSPDPPLDADDTKQVFTLTASTWQMMLSEYNGANWVTQFGFKGTMTGSGNTLTVTLTDISIPPLYLDNWYGASYWNPSYPYLYYVYYYMIYYEMGDITFDITYSLSSDGNTMALTMAGDTYTFTRI